jgi:hypothetical protein
VTQQNGETITKSGSKDEDLTTHPGLRLDHLDLLHGKNLNHLLHGKNLNHLLHGKNLNHLLHEKNLKDHSEAGIGCLARTPLCYRTAT